MSHTWNLVRKSPTLIWYSLTFLLAWPAPGRSFSTIWGGGRGGVLPPIFPPLPPHFPPLPPPTKFVWRQIEAIRHHIPLHRNFVWCQIEAIRHHIPLHENSVWCRIASIWHHTNIWGGEGWRGMWCRIAFSYFLRTFVNLLVWIYTEKLTKKMTCLGPSPFSFSYVDIT